MNKTFTATTALIAVLLFSGTAAATPDQETDLLYGNGTVESSAATPYVWSNSGPIGTETDLLSNLDEVGPIHDVATGERVVVIGEQDNTDDLIYQAS